MDAIETVKTIGAVCASLAAIGGVGAGFWWLIKKVVKIADAVEQLQPNGGKSISDKVNHISKSVDGLNTNVSVLSDRVGKLELYDTEIGPIIQEMKSTKRRGSR